MATYDLNAIADALAAVWQGMTTDTYDGVPDKMNAYSEIEGNVPVPAIVVELEGIDYDVAMGRGADSFVFMAHMLVADDGSVHGQKLVRALLSSGGVANSMKDRVEDDTTLGGLVSYVHFSGTRNVGTVPYNGTDYVGASLVFEVVAQ
jgi:hypothetical protein